MPKSAVAFKFSECDVVTLINMAMENRSKKALICFTAGLAALVAYRYRRSLLDSIRKITNPLGHRNIVVIENAAECQNVVSLLKQHTAKYNVLGFDVEWVTLSGKRRPCALLQLSSYSGLCALFRLCSLQHIPRSLRELLEDEDIIKVGVGPQDDAQKLSYDYGVGVANTLDLRFLAALTGHKAEGLAKLSKSILDVHLDKHWRIACSDWEAPELTETQKVYAANDALVAIEIFRKLVGELEPRIHWNPVTGGRLPKQHFERLEPFFDIRFKEGYRTDLGSKKSQKEELENCKNKGKTKASPLNNVQYRGICSRSKAMYDNCLLQAPDGELLCTIDRKKAQWYVDQKLGSEVENQDNYTVRLNFEPAGRAVGEVGRYYQTPKENRCVVCGRRDVYIRKNVVPREYRKHFPVVMKSHTSHDVLLLCPNCHQLSNISDIKIRRKLAEICDAPICSEGDATKYFENPEFKKLRSAARALLRPGNKLPDDRRRELEKIVCKCMNVTGDQLTEDLIKEAANVDVIDSNPEYREHGKQVVACFQSKLGGLIELEKVWREHFLNTMQPQYLPKLWNVNHNANRLGIRAQEGRITDEDLTVAGLGAESIAESDA